MDEFDNIPFCGTVTLGFGPLARWPGDSPDLPWHYDFAGYRGDLTRDQLLAAFEQAWAYWAELVDIRPRRVEARSQARVWGTFARIDGPSNVLAWSMLANDTNSPKEQRYDAGVPESARLPDCLHERMGWSTWQTEGEAVRALSRALVNDGRRPAAGRGAVALRPLPAVRRPRGAAGLGVRVPRLLRRPDSRPGPAAADRLERTVNDLREWSRRPRLPAVANSPTVEEMMLGCLQRIADAAERAAAPTVGPPVRGGQDAHDRLSDAVKQRLSRSILTPLAAGMRADLSHKVWLLTKAVAARATPGWADGPADSPAVGAAIIFLNETPLADLVARVPRRVGTKRAARLETAARELREAGL